MTSSVLDDTRRAPGGDVADEPAFEARGIDYIPLAERRGRPIDLLWMWAGALFNVEYVVYGALIISFGLAFWQAALVIVIGNLSYLIAGIGSLQGPQAGTSVFAITRAPFGPNGARLVSVFNWITQVGYETEGLALVVLAGLALAAKAGVALLDRPEGGADRGRRRHPAGAAAVRAPGDAARAANARAAVRRPVHPAGDLRPPQGPPRRRDRAPTSPR